MAISLSEWDDTSSEVMLGGKAFGNQRGDFRGKQLWPIHRSRASMATTGSRATLWWRFSGSTRTVSWLCWKPSSMTPCWTGGWWTVSLSKSPGAGLTISHSGCSQFSPAPLHTQSLRPSTQLPHHSFTGQLGWLEINFKYFYSPRELWSSVWILIKAFFRINKYSGDFC